MPSSTAVTCVTCMKPLVLQLDTGGEAEQSTGLEFEHEVDDDLQMQCGCHFHWECLLGNYQMNECPNCHKDLTSTSEAGEQQTLCRYTNEGGTQDDLDILPILTEETYLKAFPEERKCQAFLEFCASGDLEAIVYALEEDEEEQVKPADLLLYQNQIRTMNSGLHNAVKYDRVEVAWLLLLLASTLDIAAFPAEVILASEKNGLQRSPETNAVDIRSLRDSEGKTAEERAAEKGIAWREWVQSGRLRAPL